MLCMALVMRIIKKLISICVLERFSPMTSPTVKTPTHVGPIWPFDGDGQSRGLTPKERKLNLAYAERRSEWTWYRRP